MSDISRPSSSPKLPNENHIFRRRWTSFVSVSPVLHLLVACHQNLIDVGGDPYGLTSSHTQRA
ncbi:hypothetical protein AKJ16_DCAP00517 [Drosera capensis]